MSGIRLLIFSVLMLSVSATFHDFISSIKHPHPHPHPPKIRHKPKFPGQYVSAHNAVRLGLGLQTLRWNKTLARYARRWANERIDDCALIHSPNSPYGENLLWSQKGHWTPQDVVKCWAGESSSYDPQTNQCINGQICGHYTQIVWRSTEQIGCGRVQCNANKGFLYVCSYNPPGNYYFEGPFGGTFTKSIVYPPPGLPL